MKRILQTYWPGLLAMLFWGLSYNWTKICFIWYSPLATIFLRLLISTLLLFLYLAWKGRNIRIRQGDLKYFLGAAFFSPFLYFIGENYGLSLTTPTTTAVLISTIPLFTPVAAYFFLQERLGILNILGILVSFVGILLLLANPAARLHSHPAGLALLMLAVASAVAYGLFIKRLTHNYPPITIIAWQNAMALVFFLPFFLWFDLREVLSVPLNLKLGTSLLALAIFASSLAFILFVRMIREIGLSRSNVLANLIPLITGLAALALGQEKFGGMKILGMAVVLSGVILSQLRSMKREEKAAAALPQIPPQ